MQEESLPIRELAKFWCREFLFRFFKCHFCK